MSNRAGEADLLHRLLLNELAAIPVENWRFFFPAHVAVWRFIEEVRPGVLGELSAGFDEEPYFRGRGAEWFCGSLGESSAYLDKLEHIMYSVVNGLDRATLQQGVVSRGDVPPLDDESVTQLGQIVLEEVDRALATGALTIDNA